MKIISKFKDFYDSAIAYGTDDTVVYKRELGVELPKGDDGIKIPRFPGLYNRHTQSVFYRGHFKDEMGLSVTKEYRFSEAFLIVAGQSYSVWRASEYRNSRLLNDSEFNNPDTVQYDLNHIYGVHSLGGVEAFFKKAHPELILSKVARINENRFQSAKDLEKRNAAYNHEKEEFFKRDLTKECLKFGAPVLLVIPKSGEVVVIKNPILKNLGAASIIDPSAIHQKIFQFVSGVMVGSENSMDKISDEFRIKKHGFDYEYGFRTRPKQKI